MTDGWAVAVLLAGTVLLAGRGPWLRRRRLQHHARVATRRLQRGAQVDLARLTRATRSHPKKDWQVGDELGSDPTASIFGPDLIGDFYQVVLAELQAWADEAGEELDSLRGPRLTDRRVALRRLRAEIRDLCGAIEEREAFWQQTFATAPEEAGEATARVRQRSSEASRVPPGPEPSPHGTARVVTEAV